MKKQVDREHYEFGKYFSKRRWISYWYQIDLINKLSPKSVLEIGAGTKFLKKYFSDTNMEYRIIDIATDLGPDILGSVDNISLNEDSFDLVCAFQVLEHLPFTKFEDSLREMKKVSKKHVLISLPYQRASFGLTLKFPLLAAKHIIFSVPMFFRKKTLAPKEHFWEIGTKNYSLSRIKKALSKHFKIVEIINPPENRYHIFFVLEKELLSSFRP